MLALLACAVSFAPAPARTALPRSACSLTASTEIDAADTRFVVEQLLLSGEPLDALLSAEQPARDATLDAALRLVDGSSTSKLASRRWPVRLPSKRATLGCFRRLLDGMTAEEPGSGSRFDDNRRRRFLLVLLRRAREANGVYALEGDAIRRRKRATSMEEMLTRTPDSLETPKYEVLAARAAWEARKYAEFAVCTTRAGRPVSDTRGPKATGVKLGAPAMPSAGAFQALAGYIFGPGNADKEKMAMTTPVLSSAAPDGAMQMSFVLPSRYWADDGAAQPPAPVDAGVRVVRKGGGALEASETLGCLWFDGFAGPEAVASRKAELTAAVADDDEWEAVPGAEPLLFQYNDPFTPPWARRNEVAIALRPRAAA